MSTATDTATPHRPPAAPPPRPPRRRRRRGSEWLLFAALLFAVMAPVSGLWDVIDGRRWFENASVTVAGTLAAGTIVRVLGRSYALVLAASAAGLVVMLTLQFLPTTALLGVVPTASTLRRALAFYPQAQEAILAQSQPVLAEDPIVFFTCLAAGLTGLMVQIVVIGLRVPALAAIPLSVFLVTSSVVKTDGAGLLHVSLTAIGFLLVLAAARVALRSAAPAAAVRTGVARQAGAIAAGSLVLMLLVPLAVPGFTQGLMPQGQRLYLFGKPSGVNPVLNLGVNLRDRLGLTTVTYYTDSPEPLYLRTAVISDLGAQRWEPSDVTVARDTSTAALDPPPGEILPQSRTPQDTTTVHTRVVTGNYLSPWLPMPSDATSVAGLTAAWGYNRETQTMFSATRSSSLDLDYTVTSVTPVIDAAALEASSAILAADPRAGALHLSPTYSDTPADLPAIITDTARRISREAGTATAYEEAVALQDELRSPEYTYSEQTPLQQGYDGNGVGVVEAFLQKKSGYCTHFSSAMALMARSLGIPSRIVVGYAPGRTNGASALGADGKQWTGYELSARSAHAWPELYFPGLGWVPFEPTPGRGTTPSYASDSPVGGPAATPSGNDEPNRSTRPEAATESAAPASAPAAGSQDTGNDGDAGGIPPVAIALVLVLAGFFGPLALRRWAKARRLRRIHHPDEWHDGPRAAWAEFLALGRDYGLAQRPSETDAGYTARLKAHLPDVAPALDRVREAFERATYSRDTGPRRQLVPRGPATGVHRQRATRELPVDVALAAALAEIEQAFSNAATPGRQFLARAWPASLFRG